MTDIEILIPISTEPDGSPTAPDALLLCRDGIDRNTPVCSHVTRQISISDREGPTSNLLQAILESTAEYVAIIPPSHAITDPSWFGKMQAPFLRTPSCGLAISADDPKLTGKGMEPFPWRARAGAPGDLVFAPRETLMAIARAAKLLHYSEALYLAANSLGLATWAIPNVRIDIAGAKASTTRTQSPNAHRPG